MTNKIIITYVYHSCYTVEVGDYFIIFDYYKGLLNIPADKEVIFVATHGHSDHYTSEILKVPYMEDKTYILSYDIGKLESNENIIFIKDNRLGMDQLKSLYNSDNVHFVNPNEEHVLRMKNDKPLGFKTFGSTDKGISIILYVDGVDIFHAGDLNYWAWPKNNDKTMQDEYDQFMKEVAKLKHENIDIAFFPVDYRLEENYYKGADVFIKETHPQVFFPMHSGGHEEVTVNFARDYEYEGTMIRPIYEPNQKIVIDIGE